MFDSVSQVQPVTDRRTEQGDDARWRKVRTYRLCRKPHLPSLQLSEAPLHANIIIIVTKYGRTDALYDRDRN